MTRVTFLQLNSVVQRNLHRNYSKLAGLQEQLSSGRRINRPSDAPVDTTNALELREGLSSHSQFKRNASDGISYLTIVDSALSGASNVLQNIRELTVQGSNDTYTATDRRYIANDMRQLLLQMVSISNTAYKGDYIFSGTQTDTPPYTVEKGRENIDSVDNSALNPTDTIFALNTPIQLWDRTINDSNTQSGNAEARLIIPGSVKIQSLTEGTDYEVDFLKGTITFRTAEAQVLADAGALDIEYDWVRRNEKDMNGQVLRQIDTGVVAQINQTPDKVFGAKTQQDTFGSIIQVLAALYNNEGPKIREGMTNLDRSFERILGSQSEAGAIYNRLDSTNDRNERKVLEIVRMQSTLEDVDFAEAISNFTLAENIFNASLQSSARVIQPSLLNFL
jgi:flagellar hook-associated protein 3 FlgL